MQTKLFSTLCSPGHLLRAWQDVKAKKAGGGIDGETIATFEINLQNNLQSIREELLQGKKGSVCCSNHPAKRGFYPVAMATGQVRVQLLPLIRYSYCARIIKTPTFCVWILTITLIT